MRADSTRSLLRSRSRRWRRRSVRARFGRINGKAIAEYQRPSPIFTADYAPDDAVMASRLLKAAHLSESEGARIERTAAGLIDAIRTSDHRRGGVEDMLREFALSTKEGLALMVLAE